MKRQRIERSYYCPKPTHWEKFSLVVPELIKHLDGPGPAVPGVVSEEARVLVVEDVLQTQDGNSGVSGQALSTTPKVQGILRVGEQLQEIQVG